MMSQVLWYEREDGNTIIGGNNIYNIDVFVSWNLYEMMMSQLVRYEREGWQYPAGAASATSDCAALGHQYWAFSTTILCFFTKTPIQRNTADHHLEYLLTSILPHFWNTFRWVINTGPPSLPQYCAFKLKYLSNTILLLLTFIRHIQQNTADHHVE